MLARFVTNTGASGSLEYEVIQAQPMNHADGFTLVCFKSWEDYSKEEVCAAATNIIQFDISNNKDIIGFHGKDESRN